jgi:type III secretion protein Q
MKDAMTKQPGPVPLPPRLTRLARTEAQARTLIAQRARGLQAEIGGQQWQVSIGVLPGEGARTRSPGEWHVIAEWAGAPFHVTLPAATGDLWLRARFPELDLPQLPDPLRATALEDASTRVLSAVNALQRGPARIDSVSTQAPAAGLAHRFDVELASGEQVLYATLATDSLGLMLMGGALAQRLPSPGPLDSDALPFVLRAEIGTTALDAAVARSLAVGDAVFIEHAWIAQDGELWLGQDGWGLRAKYEDKRLAVTQPFNKTELPMATEPSTPAALDAMPVRLHFDLGERTLTLGELKALQVGQTLELAQPLSQAVSIRVGGSLVGNGELVEIDGRLAVSITALGPAAGA